MKSIVSIFLTVILVLGLAACGDNETRENKFANLEKKAAGGDVSAWYKLGLLHEQGCGIAQDKFQVALCYRQAAEKGQVQAQYRLGFLYYHGHGVPRDLKQAAFWYKKAADQGSPEAKAALDNMYLSGEAVPKDGSKVVHRQRKTSR
jgi:TPR repeat protein